MFSDTERRESAKESPGAVLPFQKFAHQTQHQGFRAWWVLSQNTRFYPYKIQDRMSTGMNPNLFAVKYKACSGSDERGCAEEKPREDANHPGLRREVSK
jgi:hypothetical protein